MEIEIETEARITQLLLWAARRRKLIPYGTFHAIFAPSIALARRYALLEAVASSICDIKTADYAALLCADSGLPGPDFYARFKRVNSERYYAALGADRQRGLKLVEKQRFAREVRDQVYRHASAAGRDVSPGNPIPLQEAPVAHTVHPVCNLVLGLALVAAGLLAAPRADAQEFSSFGAGSQTCAVVRI
jgi:hypothetical protein